MGFHASWFAAVEVCGEYFFEYLTVKSEVEKIVCVCD